MFAAFALALALVFPSGAEQPLCPIDAPTEFTNTWGGARSGGRSHKGTDMFADYYARVVAPEDGRIEWDTNRLGGNVVRIWADSGRYYYLAHQAMQATWWEKDGRIERGDTIGFVGTSGNARGTSPHVHAEVSDNGRRSNPYKFLKQACSTVSGTWE